MLVIGLGAAGVAVTKILLDAGVRHVIGADSRGVVSTEREDYLDGSMNAVKRWYAEVSNPEQLTGRPADVIDGMDLFIGLSRRARHAGRGAGAHGPRRDGLRDGQPEPRRSRPRRPRPYVRIMATGRSDYPNQINNVLAFPGIFRGALDVRATQHHRAR